MRSVIVRPQNAAISIQSDNVGGNNSRCSMAYLLQTRRRRFFSLVTILTIVVICAFVIPLVTILNIYDYTRQPETTTTTATTTSEILSTDFNLTTYDLPTIDTNGSTIW